MAKAETPKPAPASPAKAPRTRSPNYPALTLEDALKKADTLYEANDQHFAQWEAAAQQLSYTATSSSFAKAIGALAHFGLIDDRGSAGNRQVKVSNRYLDIKLQPAGSPSRKKALFEAALTPKLHRELWDKYDHKLPPSDDSIRFYLLRERADGNFNRASVDSFIDQFRKSLQFGGVTGGEKIDDDPLADTPKNGNEGNAPKSNVQVGAFAQWTSQGIDRFQQPKRVAGIDGEWAFFEDSQSGVPMSELTAVDPPQTETLSPPANPHYKPKSESDLSPAAGTAKEQKTLDEGQAILMWPGDLSAESFEDFEYWLKGVLRRARRKAGLPERKE